mmetsp:Transcript_5/g.14  ORF Transcript_5/g.14 Transcript_5/m.14 type:complete len:256 (-) Transcript_5:144-911(-)
MVPFGKSEACETGMAPRLTRSLNPSLLSVFDACCIVSAYPCARDPNDGSLSYTVHGISLCCSAKARAHPPMPPPTITTLGAFTGAYSGTDSGRGLFRMPTVTPSPLHCLHTDNDCASHCLTSSRFSGWRFVRLEVTEPPLSHLGAFWDDWRLELLAILTSLFTFLGVLSPQDWASSSSRWRRLRCSMAPALPASAALRRASSRASLSLRFLARDGLKAEMRKPRERQAPHARTAEGGVAMESYLPCKRLGWLNAG